MQSLKLNAPVVLDGWHDVDLAVGFREPTGGYNHLRPFIFCSRTGGDRVTPAAMKWFVRAIGILVVVVVLAIALSFTLPAQTRHTRAIVLKQPPEAIFTVLADVEKLPTWRRNLEKVEMLPPIDGKEATKQTFKGGVTITVVTTESLAPTHLVRTLRDVSGHTFTGSWTYEITPTNEGCEIALTEKTYIGNPMFRLLVWLSGSTRYIDQQLVDLGRHFGEKPIIRSKRPEIRA